jgi:phospholipid/cholesterol/gamma-HCH transport system substrate-binding protein
MKLLDKETSIDAVKLLVFILVTTLATGLLIVTIGNLSFQPSTQYTAVFSDATGVTKGDDVRIAGVKVGNVQQVDVVRRTRALVTFKVDKDQLLTRSTLATIRYRNLVGQRYISLSQGIGGPDVLKDGATIPIDRTRPALDLTVLFNGFKPLFKALTPADINKLSYEIVTVFQGEGGTLESLLSHTASVTSTLASRDELIGSLISHLNEVMVTIGTRDKQLSDLIVKLRIFVSGLAGDRQAILGSLDSISSLAVQTSGLVTDIRPPLTTDVKQLRRVAGTLDKNKAEIDRALQVLPIKLTKIGRTATYGSFFNFYLCSLTGNIKLPKLPDVPLPGAPQLPSRIPLTFKAAGQRCDV